MEKIEKISRSEKGKLKYEDKQKNKKILDKYKINCEDFETILKNSTQQKDEEFYER